MVYIQFVICASSVTEVTATLIIKCMRGWCGKW